ncbi:hypothetical protein NQ318_020022 [Aromia moschata]|uniref:Uncharacterized protein n=1 Tax=Aromia moschata TaxID=1265417 RepID=A0AAV8ZB31_9CUCU|nr:hypothetical protein NQ318_020022 [Aromia moschata]
MDNLRSVLDYIRSFFGPPSLQRKRRAPDPLETFLSPKYRRIHISMPRDFEDNWVHRNPRDDLFC